MADMGWGRPIQAPIDALVLDSIMIAARPVSGLSAGPCPARLAPRLAACRVQAAQRRPPTTQRSEPLAPQLLAALETAALVLAVGGHAAALLSAQQHAAAIAQAALRQQQQQRSSSSSSNSSNVRVAQAQAAALPPPASAWATPGGAWLTLPLVAALVLGRLRSWLSRGSRSAQPQRAPSQEAVARLLRLEAATGQQAAQLEALARQLDKLSVRSRLAGRDLKLPLKQLQLAAGQQAEALVGVAQRMERLEKDIRDTEDLVGAMQGVSAKQFQLLLKVVEQQQAAAKQGGPRQAAGKAAGKGAGAAAASGAQPSREGPAKAGAGSSLGKQGAAPWPYGAGAGRSQQDAGPAAGAEAAIDEWGRRVVPLPQQQQQLPPIPNGAAASALSSDSGGPPDELPQQPDRPPPAGSAAPDSFATGATLPEGLLASLEALKAAQRAGGGAGAKPGLSTQALLDILDSDPRFRAERSMISALLNAQPKVERPGVEILPPLGPRPALPLDEDEQEAQARLVEEWRERVARAWSMTPPEGAAQGGAGEAADAGEGEGGSEGADADQGPAEDAAPHDGSGAHSDASDGGGDGGAAHSDSGDDSSSEGGSDCGGGADFD